MKIINGMHHLVFFGAILFTSSTFAYNTKSSNYGCKDPKFISYYPLPRIKGEPVPEVDAESEISISVSNNADRTSIRVKIKKLTFKPTVEDKGNFYKATIKLPAELNGKFARINVSAKSTGGVCSSKGGWLIKIKDAVNNTEAQESKVN